MPRIMFWGESTFTFLGLKSILFDFFLVFEILHTPLSSEDFSYYFLSRKNSDFIIVEPCEDNFLHYVKVMREMPANNILVLAEENVYNLFEIMCGRRFYFVNSDAPLPVLFELIFSFLNGTVIVANNYRKRITEVEFRIILLMAKGWSLTKIASFTHRSVKTVSAHKINILRKLNLTDGQLKLLVSKEKID